MNPRIFSHAESPAPALSRGLAVLVMLGGETALSLEALSQRLELPKASVFRLLETLQKTGLVRKAPDKSYEALFALRPLTDATGLFRERVEKEMAGLCRRLEVTVEWYEPTTEGMRLTSQANPECELRVQAKPGFVRRWGEELDAVARLGYAFAPQAPSPVRAFRYAANGVTENLPVRIARELRDAARQALTAADAYFNTNGVRRCAVAVRPDGDFRGTLAIAEAYHFSQPSRTEHFLNELTKIARTL
jgi:DNA-binding IclR family transcriptional regulator